MLGVLAVALSLRPAIASISPVLEAIRTDLNLSYTAVSLLTTIPTLCMGVFALTIPVISARIGYKRGVFWGTILISVATAARIGSHSILVLFGSTLLVGIGIAVTQALLPSLVNEYFTDRESFATGLYTASLTIGAALAGGITAPISDWLDSWAVALAVWAIPATLAVPLWYQSRHQISRRSKGSDTRDNPAQLPWRNRLGLVVTLYFGGSSTVFFFVLTWLAPRYVSLGWSSSRAGLLLSMFVLTQLGGNLLVSALGDRVDDQRPLFALMMILIISGASGISAAPQLFPWIWVVLLGAGAGGSFTLGLTLPIIFTSEPKATDGLTSLMLGGGYIIAAFGPLVAGLLRDITKSYAVAFGGLVVLGVGLLGISMWFGPNRETVQIETQQEAENKQIDR